MSNALHGDIRRLTTSLVVTMLFSATLVAGTASANAGEPLRFVATADLHFQGAVEGISDRTLKTAELRQACSSDDDQLFCYDNTGNIATIERMKQLVFEEGYRGMITAGDTTQIPSNDEWNLYNAVLGEDGSRYMYDGFGNHDVRCNGHHERSHGIDGAKCNFNQHPRSVGPPPGDWIEQLVSRDRWESSGHTIMHCADVLVDRGGNRLNDNHTYGRECPNYSWEWGGVHFLQLNVFPGDPVANVRDRLHDPSACTTAVDDCARKYLRAMNFLIWDLRHRVGNSGKPVVLIQHYGFDEFSTNGEWWSQGQRERLWDVIASYNVIAILTGHVHVKPTRNGNPTTGNTFHRPDGLSGPDQITGIHVGTGVGGYFTTFEISPKQAGSTQRTMTVETRRVNWTGSYDADRVDLTKNNVVVDRADPDVVINSTTLAFDDPAPAPIPELKSLVDGRTGAPLDGLVTGPDVDPTWTLCVDDCSESKARPKYSAEVILEPQNGGRSLLLGGPCISYPTCTQSASQSDDYPDELPDGDYRLLVRPRRQFPFDKGAVTEAVFTVNAPPIADAGGPYSGHEGERIILDGTGSSDPGGEQLRYAWDLDEDGVFDDATGPTPDHAWGDDPPDGALQVALEVTDEAGQRAVATAQVNLTNVAPTQTLDVASREDEGAAVEAAGVVTDPGWLDELTVTIDWGDGRNSEVSGTRESEPPDATVTWSASHAYGDNGLYPVEVCATDDEGAGGCLTRDVVVDNVPPAVTIDAEQVTRIAEGDTLQLAGSFLEPGWLDTYGGVIDWGTGDRTAASLDVTSEGPPADVGTVAGSHRYGDDGAFEVTAALTDDDGGTGSATVAVTVDNVAPTAVLDRTGQTAINGTDVFFAHTGQELSFSGRSRDPGSDDLLAEWDFGDGSPGSSTPYLNEPPDADGSRSPSVNPRDISDSAAHIYSQACRYEVTFTSADDDGGAGVDAATAVITGDAESVRGAGHWKQRMRSAARSDSDHPEEECLLEIAGLLSRVFSEARDASTVEHAHAVLSEPARGDMRVIFDRQLLAAWLNFADGAFDPTLMVDSDGDGEADMPFADFITEAENTRLDPEASRRQLERYKDALEEINTVRPPRHAPT